MSCAHCGLPVPVARRAADVQSPQFCCFGCRFAFELSRPGQSDTSPGSPIFFRLGVGIFLTMNIMVFTWFFHSRELFSPDEPFNALAALLAYLLMFLCSGVVAALGAPLVHDAVANVTASRGRADANLLICVGVLAAFILSAVNTVRGEGSLYFDTAAMILVLVTLGQYLDSTAKRRATAAASTLLASIATRAWVERDGLVIEVDADAVRLGEQVRVRPGEASPVDGVVVSGDSHLDESKLTGESKPRAVTQGDRVLAGTINLDGLLWVEAQRVGADRTIAQVQRLLLEARAMQPPIQRLADRVAAAFVPMVIVLAVGVFAFHAWRGAAPRGLFDALSVLLISCPCALGLAAPLASWSALSRAARHGIVIDSAVTLERAAGVRRVFFDKTGTLTDPRLVVAGIAAHGIDEADALRIAASIEQASTHPIAAAITRCASERGLAVAAATQARILPGVGIEATIDGRTYQLGSQRLLTSLAPRERQEQAADDLVIHLVAAPARLASFTLTERLRGDAISAIGQLQRDGMDVAILTGDSEGPARRVASQLGVPVEHSLLPQDKLDRLMAARKQAGGVAMVGDGINDGPVLAAADVGVAVAGGADLAHQAGHVRLIADALDRVPLLLAIARDCHRRIRFNLTWAFGYNCIGIALATAGLLSPIFAATAMFGSSLIIVHVARGAGGADTMEARTLDADAGAPAAAGVA